MAKTTKVDGGIKPPGRPMTEAEYNKMREKAAQQKKRRTVKRKTTSK